MNKNISVSFHRYKIFDDERNIDFHFCLRCVKYAFHTFLEWTKDYITLYNVITYVIYISNKFCCVNLFPYNGNKIDNYDRYDRIY